MVLDTRFELVTTSMSWRHSTAELIEQIKRSRIIFFFDLNGGYLSIFNELNLQPK